MVNVFHNLKIVDYQLKGSKLESLTVEYDNSMNIHNFIKGTD